MRLSLSLSLSLFELSPLVLIVLVALLLQLARIKEEEDQEESRCWPWNSDQRYVAVALCMCCVFGYWLLIALYVGTVEYSCKMQRSGKLLLYQTQLQFQAKVLGLEKKIEIPYSDIQKIELTKDKTVRLKLNGKAKAAEV
jgi:heme/copper-type cytochrome/quinol oxidase subunit 2